MTNYAPQFKDKTLDELYAMETKCAARVGVLADPIMLNIIRQEIASRSELPAPYCDLCGESEVTVKFLEIGCCDDCAETEIRRQMAPLLGQICATYIWQDNGQPAICIAPSGIEHDHDSGTHTVTEPRTDLVWDHAKNAIVSTEPGYTCRGCGREESVCSADPCEGVKRDREA